MAGGPGTASACASGCRFWLQVRGRLWERRSGVFQGKGPSGVPGMASGGAGAEVALLVGACGAGALAGPGCLGRKCPLCC